MLIYTIWSFYDTKVDLVQPDCSQGKFDPLSPSTLAQNNKKFTLKSWINWKDYGDRKSVV